MLKNGTTTLIAHIAGWILFLSLVLAFVSNNSSIAATIFTGSFILFCLIYLFVFYLNSFILIPQFYLKKKYIVYAIIILILFIVIYYLRPFDRMMMDLMGAPGKPDFNPGPPPPTGEIHHMPPPMNSNRSRGRTDIAGLIIFVGVWSLSTAICIIRQWRFSEQKLIQAEADSANAELSFLKAQVSPHFLFNTLNNIYTLALTKNENTAASVMKLSNIMRYMMDDVRQEFVPLANELECIQDYIDLQKLRLTRITEVQFKIEGNTLGKDIAPLILMTFIENAFKYGVSNHDHSIISISISIRDRQLIFECENKKFLRQSGLERVGIGLQNTKRRLEKMYSKKHQLDIEDSEHRFFVRLKIDS